MQRTLGVQLDEDGAYWACIRHEKTPTLVDFGHIATEQFVDPIPYLAEHLNRAGLAKCPMAFSTNVAKPFAKWLTVPQVPDEDLSAVAAFRLRKQLPNGVDGTLVSAVRGEGADSEDVLLLGAPSGNIKSALASFFKEGIEPRCAELEAQPILRVLSESVKRRHEAGILTVIHVGRSQTHLLIVDKGRLSFFRSIPYGVLRLFAEVARVTDSSVDRVAVQVSAGAMILDSRGSLALAADPLNPIAHVGKVFEGWHRELQRVLQYGRSVTSGRSFSSVFDKVLFCGPGTRVRGLAAYWHEMLGVNLEPSGEPHGCDIDVPKSRFSPAGYTLADYSVAIGLALSPSILTTTGGAHDAVYEWTRFAATSHA